MFSLKEMIVYPGHGVAKIERIVEKKVAGLITQFFELHFLHIDMTILVPVPNAIAVGIRKLSSQENINQVFAFLAKPFSGRTLLKTVASALASATSDHLS